MAGRKNKNRQRGQRQQQPGSGEPTELLDELHSIRSLLGSEDLADIPLLDQVADPAPRPPRREARPQVTPLQDTDLPTLFSPEDEELPEEEPHSPPAPEPRTKAIATELSETELELLRPLEAIPPQSRANPGGTPPAGDEQQQELFGEPETGSSAIENPFLPAHIRARLTGGRVPRSEERAGSPAGGDAGTQEARASGAAATAGASPHHEDHQPETAHESPAAGDSEPAGTPTAAQRARERQRQQLVDRLVAKQLPELERQLRARIELMVDELMRNR
ncbi:hypothetical protein [Microbulbifer yueqingensis]|uniref:Uncharacterized protein n=1 Tax=Microbulbifer yueqingensis TaxID=658219 RepID=A0A1G8WWU4_9GAMM|nr:hypothetical protein [Microbulbifer yueqingensis]SDJ82546.1 hypothetical protein SAMN05216212_0879 [Microbulbifer yueqingensis]